jgi:transposase
MLLSYKFRLYPNSSQRQALDRILEIHRQVYNAALKTSYILSRPKLIPG